MTAAPALRRQHIPARQLVIATAGHIDHGKSALIRALTGMEPDRWAEERRRGITIGLGYAWTTLRSGTRLAFVDVPGHERFVPTMLAGVGAVPAVLFVVAADGGWMPQSAEHLAAIRAVGVTHLLLAVTRCDLADPATARAAALCRLGEVDSVCVSAVSGAGIPELRSALQRMAAAIPAPDPSSDVRLWVDRSFSIAGAGTVVTGTLPAGRLRAADTLLHQRTGRQLALRGLRSLGEEVPGVTGPARVALNLRGVPASDIRRGDALLTGRWLSVAEFDVRLTEPGRLPDEVTAHLGSAAPRARVRPIGGDTARVRLAAPLPIRVGDRMVLRDPGGSAGPAGHRALVGAIALDVAPPPIQRRGRGARAAQLAEMHVPDPGGEIRRRALVTREELDAMGVPVPPGLSPVAGDVFADPAHWARLRSALAELLVERQRTRPLEDGLSTGAAGRALRLPPDRIDVLLPELARTIPEVELCAGWIRLAGGGLDPELAAAVRRLGERWEAQPFAAPDASDLGALGLGPRQLAAAARAGALLRIAPGIVLAPGTDQHAAARLATIAQPFTVSAARRALDTTRRVAVPLLEHLDACGLTRRLPDDTRTTSAPAMAANTVTL